MTKWAYKLVGGKVIEVEEKITVGPGGALLSTTTAKFAEEGTGMIATDERVTVRAMIEIEFTPNDRGDHNLHTKLGSIAETLGDMHYREVRIAGVDARITDIGRIVVDDLPTTTTSEETTMTFSSHGDMVDRVRDLLNEEWVAEVMLRVRPVAAGFKGTMPGETIAEALRNLADQFEVQ